MTRGTRRSAAASRAETWEDVYEFNGTKLQEFPLPSAYPLELSRRARRLGAAARHGDARRRSRPPGCPTRERLAAARDEWQSIRARMIALQEELDWEVYSLYGLLDEESDRRRPARCRS